MMVSKCTTPRFLSPGPTHRPLPCHSHLSQCPVLCASLCVQQKLGAQLERMMTVVTGQRAASESEIQEGDVPPEGQPDPTKVQLVEDDDGE